MVLFDARALPPALLKAFTRKDALAWFESPADLVVDVNAFEAAHAAWRTKHAAGPLDADRPPWERFGARCDLCDWILDCGRKGLPIRYTTLWRERHGGRRYFLNVEGATKLEAFGRWEPPPKYAQAKSRWLQQVPKDIRRVGLRARDGRVLVEADISQAFLTFLAWASGDEVLQADLAGGSLHDKVAEELKIDRSVAKVLNNSLVGLGGPAVVERALRAEGVPVKDGEPEAFRDRWWSRYDVAARFRRRLQRRWDEAGAKGERAEIFAPDGRRIQFSPAEVAGTPLENGSVVGFPTAFSAIWRSIEGLVMDEAISELHKVRDRTGLRLVLPMFDGVVYEVAEERGTRASRYVKLAITDALRNVGVPGSASVTVDRHWGAGTRG